MMFFSAYAYAEKERLSHRFAIELEKAQKRVRELDDWKLLLFPILYDSAFILVNNNNDIKPMMFIVITVAYRFLILCLVIFFISTINSSSFVLNPAECIIRFSLFVCLR